MPIRRVPKDTALVRQGLGGNQVRFGWALVLPILHRGELIDLSEKRIAISLTEKDGLSCRDGIKADICLAFFLRVIANPEAILKVHRTLGGERTFDENALRPHFEARFLETMKRCARRLDFDQLRDDPDGFQDAVLDAVGDDLNGFTIDRAVVEHLEQTALEFHDPRNIIDAEGIKKITEREAERRRAANEIRRAQERREATERAGRSRHESED